MNGERPVRAGLISVLVAGLATASSARIRADEPAPTPAPEAVEFFESKVRPLLAQHCYECHGPESQKGGLRLDSADAARTGGDSGPAVVPGNLEESLLIEAVGYDGAYQMPPDGKLPEESLAALTEWVRQGAAWTPGDTTPPPDATAGPEAITAEDRAFWAFQPVREPSPPAVRDAAWVRTPVDAFVLARLEAEGLSPSSPADPRALLRRVTFDLTGLPPTPEEVEAFANDTSPDAYERLVDRLLASPRYGERWARHWLDVARYGEDQAHSFKPRLYPSGYRYRDWVAAALNADLPYDRFLVEQIAADLLEEPGRMERLPALGFFACGPVYYGDSKGFDQIDDRIDTLTRGTLGLTVACARCHDHKYDPIPTTDYYALAGVVASTSYDETPLAPPEIVEARKRAEEAVAAKEKELAEFLEAEAKRLDIPKDKVEKKLPDESRERVKAMRAERKRLEADLPPMYPVVHALKEGEPKAMRVLVRGNPETPGAEVPRRFLSILGGESFAQGSGRLELARAIASPSNPLTSRVQVNRVWMHHFGRGLVATPGNFGSLGERPSHPELLDWLAARFVADGWSLKALHRTILLSSTYRQVSRPDPTSLAIDPENRLLWRMSPRRLEVEAWRDAMLMVAGRLDPAIGGPSRPIDEPDNLRRTLYAAVSRHDLAPLLRLFDFPDPNITSPQRTRTTVPLQQLFVLNDGLVVAGARALAGRVASEAGPDTSARIARAYALLFARPPTEAETNLGLAYLRAAEADAGEDPKADGLNRWERYAQALLGSNEFAYLD